MGDTSCSHAMYAPVHDAASEMAGAREIDQSLLDDLVMPSYIYEVEVAPSPSGTEGPVAVAHMYRVVYSQQLAACWTTGMWKSVTTFGRWLGDRSAESMRTANTSALLTAARQRTPHALESPTSFA